MGKNYNKYGFGFGLDLWHINPYRLFDAKFILKI